MNEVDTLPLTIYRNTDLSFTVEWWEDDDETQPIAVSGAVGYVLQRYTDEVILDLADYVSVAGNIVTVNIPRAVTADLELEDDAKWEFKLISSEGEHKPIVKGPAVITGSGR